MPQTATAINNVDNQQDGEMTDSDVSSKLISNAVYINIVDNSFILSQLFNPITISCMVTLCTHPPFIATLPQKDKYLTVDNHYLPPLLQLDRKVQIVHNQSFQAWLCHCVFVAAKAVLTASLLSA